MFERYTERARRSIFFARYEASHYGSAYIETEHILLGILREDHRIRQASDLAELVRKRIEETYVIKEKIAISVDLPLADDARRVLAYAAEEAERLSHKHIGTEHLLLGMLRESECFAAAVLHDAGFELEKIRQWCESIAPGTTEIGRSAVIGRSQPEAVFEFVCRGEVVGGSYTGFGLLPRIGERVLLKRESGNGESYRVKNLTYAYDHLPYEGKIPQHRIEKVIIDLEPE